MSDHAVIEVVAAARRLRSRAEWLELRATREFARRRWETGAEPVKRPDGTWRRPDSDAEQAADELAFRLAQSRRASEDQMDLSLALRDRLPRMDGQLADGRVDEYRCQVVHDVTAALPDDDARLVDEMIAPDAPQMKYDALRRRAAKLALRLDPDSDRERKQRATRKKARVEVFPEKSGNYAYAGRELPIDQVLASEAHIRGLAQYLRACGIPGSLRELELMVYLDLTQGRDPRDRIPGTSGPQGDHTQGAGIGRDDAREPRGTSSGNAEGQDGGDDRESNSATNVDPSGSVGQPTGQGWRAEGDWRGEDWDGGNRDDEGDAEDVDGDEEGTVGGNRRGEGGDSGNGNGEWLGPFSPPGPGKPGGRAPFPAKINLLVPVGTAYGWSTMPGEAGREIIDPKTLREMAEAASHHRSTRWCVTLVGDDGTAVAHGCARGQHTWTPPPATRDEAPAPAQLQELEQFLRQLRVDFEPIAKGECDHRQAEPRYRPSRKLQDLVRARNATCPAPGCGASSANSDLDHTEHWPHGPTCECNFGVPCRHHHRTKQAPGWKLEQQEPGVFTWTTPSGHVYCTGPTRYDA
jgi:hypothetical protein